MKIQKDDAPDTEENQRLRACRSPTMQQSPTAPMIRLHQDRSLSGRSSPARWKRDAVVLQTLLDEEPRNPRAAFYLGNTFVQLGNCSAAIDAYKLRIDITDDGWWEERESAMLQIVLCAKPVSHLKKGRKKIVLIVFSLFNIDCLNLM